MKVIALSLLFIIIGCSSSNVGKVKMCSGYPLSVKQAIKNPDKAKYVALFDYKDSVFPSSEFMVLKNLECLRLFDNSSIIKLSKGKSFKLKEISFDTNRLRKFEMLSRINFAFYKINNLEDALNVLSDLEYLSLDASLLYSIPKSIFRMKNLKTLSLSLNSISDLPPHFGNLKNLQVLDMGNNELREIPSVLFELTNLQILNIANPEGIDVKKHKIGFGVNRIDYLKEMDKLIRLLSLPNIKKVSIEIRDNATKFKVKERLRKEGVFNKIRISSID